MNTHNHLLVASLFTLISATAIPPPKFHPFRETMLHRRIAGRKLVPVHARVLPTCCNRFGNIQNLKRHLRVPPTQVFVDTFLDMNNRIYRLMIFWSRRLSEMIWIDEYVLYIHIYYKSTKTFISCFVTLFDALWIQMCYYLRGTDEYIKIWFLFDCWSIFV